MRSLKADPATVRSQNRRLILDLLRTEGPLSRIQLADATGLSTASMTTVTAELIGDGWISEQGTTQASSGGGRRPILLNINYDSHFAIGVKIRQERIDAGLTDLSTRVLAHTTLPVTSTAPEDILRDLHTVCTRLLEERGLTFDRLLGIGLALSGIVDFTTGTAVQTPQLGWQGVPIAEMASAHLGVPVWADNDVNAYAVAEHLFGHAKKHQNVLVVTAGRGVGAAFILDGQVFRGRGGGSGEFGHNVIVDGGRLCTCGQHGCLEAYTSEPALIAQYAERHPELGGITADLIAEHARSGHEDALALLQDAGTLLGRHVSYLVNTVDPELILFGGEASRLGDPYLAPLQAAIRDLAFAGRARNLPFIVDPWTDDTFLPWVRGAASLAVHRAFDLGIV